MSDESKEFEASAQKLNKLRQEGNVPKSKDLSTAIAIIIMFSVINLLGPFIWGQLSALFKGVYEQLPNKHLEDIGYAYLFVKALLPTALILMPILLMAAFTGILGDMLQVGPLFTTKPLQFNPGKFNPTRYFKNLASPKTVFDLIKNIVKVAILGIIGYIVYRTHFEQILMLALIDNHFAILIQFGSLVFDFVIKAGLAFLIIAAADYGFTKWKFLQDNKMSAKEVKDEYKNSEGDPNVKAKLRQRRQQIMQQRMMDEVKTCDFVVTNPTHVACAIKYDAQKMDSPTLVAKGTELFAHKIKEIAREYNIPIIENPPVARALFRFVEINHQIPPDLYKAVAEILIFVYKLKKTTAQEQKRIQETAKKRGDIQTQQEIARKREEQLKPFRDSEDGEKK